MADLRHEPDARIRRGSPARKAALTDAGDWPPARRGWYATFVLLLAYTFSFVDRQVLNLLVEPIQADLKISDTEISFLQGSAFVFTYVLLSVPIGRLVDRFHRIRIMMVGVLVWSLTTVACGLARSYSQLLVARMGVGAGESSVTPAAWSVLSDYFPADRLSRPVSVYLMGPYLGAGLAMIAGAEVLDWTREVDSIAVPGLGDLAPWQFTFLAVGLPGLAIAALLASVREPPRKGRERRREATLKAPPWGDVIAYLKEHKRIYCALHLGVPFIVVMLYGLQAWIPTVLVRVYEWDLAQAGRIYGVLALVAGSSGVLSGPFVARILERRGKPDAALRVAMFGAMAAAVSLGMLPLQATPVGALVCVALASFFVTLPLALMTSALQLVTPNEMRGVVAGAYVVTVNVIGLGLGPTLVAASTDYIFGDPRAVAQSLALVSLCMGPIAVALLGVGLRPYAARVRELDVRA